MDLNADLGEGFGRWELTDDAALLRVVTSANVACGFHAGDPARLHRACETAADLGTRVGAQVSYNDLAGFGRREMDVPADELAAEVAYQIGGLGVFARAEGDRVRYVKPHGALYHRASRDRDQAQAVVAGMMTAEIEVLLCPPGSELERTARASGLETVIEGFADRGYRADGSLVPRGEPGALLSAPDMAAAQAVQIATQGTVTAVDGRVVELRAGSICVHGDSPGAVAIAAAVRAALEEQGIKLEAFT